MTTYLFTYRAPLGYQGGPDALDAWNAFFEGLGDHLVDAGNPVFERSTLGNCGADIAPLGGYSLIRADDLPSAVELAKSCPILEQGGGVEVGVITVLDDVRTTNRQTGSA